MDDDTTVGAGPADGLRCVVRVVARVVPSAVVVRGAAATAFGAAGLLDDTTVGAGPADGLRRTVATFVARGTVVTVAAAGFGAAGFGAAIKVGAGPGDGFL